jgi:hypothetical protein
MTGISKLGGIISIFSYAGVIALYYNRKQFERDFRSRLVKDKTARKRCSFSSTKDEEEVNESMKKLVSYENIWNMTIRLEELEKKLEI